MDVPGVNQAVLAHQAHFHLSPLLLQFIHVWQKLEMKPDMKEESDKQPSQKIRISRTENSSNHRWWFRHSLTNFAKKNNNTVFSQMNIAYIQDIHFLCFLSFVVVLESNS